MDRTISSASSATYDNFSLCVRNMAEEVIDQCTAFIHNFFKKTCYCKEFIETADFSEHQIKEFFLKNLDYLIEMVQKISSDLCLQQCNINNKMQENISVEEEIDSGIKNEPIDKSDNPNDFDNLSFLCHDNPVKKFNLQLCAIESRNSTDPSDKSCTVDSSGNGDTYTAIKNGPVARIKLIDCVKHKQTLNYVINNKTEREIHSQDINSASQDNCSELSTCQIVNDDVDALSDNDSKDTVIFSWKTIVEDEQTLFFQSSMFQDKISDEVCHSKEEFMKCIDLISNKDSNSTAKFSNTNTSSDDERCSSLSTSSSLNRLEAYCSIKYNSSDSSSPNSSVRTDNSLTLSTEQIEDQLIDKLLNIKNLEKELVEKTSSQLAALSKQTKTKKKNKTQSLDGDESFNSNSSDSLFDINDYNRDLNCEPKDDVSLDLFSDFSRCSSTSSETNIASKRKVHAKTRKHVKKFKFNEENSSSDWTKDKLLIDKLFTSDDSDSTGSEPVATELMNRTNQFKEVHDKVTDGNEISADPTDDNITISDCTVSSMCDSDCQVINVKQEKDYDVPVKGRKNIRKVISDDVLEEKTKLANKEEDERKARISSKKKSLVNVLSQSQIIEDGDRLVLDIEDATKRPLISVNTHLTAMLKPHQKEGIKFMWDMCFESVKRLREDGGTGCILAHCMGLGKTRQIVVFSYVLLTHEITNVKNILIVCPLSTIFNWENEFETILELEQTNHTRINVFSIKNKEMIRKIGIISRWQQQGGVLLLGYDQFKSLIEPSKSQAKYFNEEYKNILQQALVNPGPDLVICDEGHMLKNGKTMRFKSFLKTTTKRRIILTGTPLQNNLTEYYFMVNFVKPNLLGTFKEYTNRFVNPIINGQYEDSGPADIHLMRKRSHILHKKLESTIQRYEDSELKPYLPDKIDYVLFIRLSPLQIMLYKKYLQVFSQNKGHLFTNYHNLQNIWTHPALLQTKQDKNSRKPMKTYDEDFVLNLDPDSVTDNIFDSYGTTSDYPPDLKTNLDYGPKIKILFSIINGCEEVGDKLLVFSSYMAELDLIESFLKHGTLKTKKWTKNIDYLRMDGHVTPEMRKKYCNQFNSGKKNTIKLFLISHKVGGLGLNLVAANRVVLMDVSWNPSYDIQSIFRVYRFGQTKKCFIYRLVSMGTMEEVVYSRAITKLAIAGRVVDEYQMSRHFKSDELQKMYQLNCDYAERPTLSLPADKLLAKLLQIYNPEIHNYHEHQSLLTNQIHEELSENERKIAWDEYNKEDEIKNSKNPLNSTAINQVDGNKFIQTINYNYQAITTQEFAPNMTNLPSTSNRSCETRNDYMPDMYKIRNTPAANYQYNSLGQPKETNANNNISRNPNQPILNAKILTDAGIDIFPIGRNNKHPAPLSTKATSNAFPSNVRNANNPTVSILHFHDLSIEVLQRENENLNSAKASISKQNEIPATNTEARQTIIKRDPKTHVDKTRPPLTIRNVTTNRLLEKEKTVILSGDLNKSNRSRVICREDTDNSNAQLLDDDEIVVLD